MRNTVIIGVLSVMCGFAAGFAVGWIAPSVLGRRVDVDWRPLAVSTQHFGLSYATEVVFSDLPLGEITDVAGKAKFIDNIGAPDSVTELGYVINVTMQDPDRAKIPGRYLKPTTSHINGITLTTEPLIMLTTRSRSSLRSKTKTDLS